MVLLELDSFQYLLDFGMAEESDVESYCAMFFYLICWAKTNGYLDQSFLECPVFKDSYNKVFNKQISMFEFVDRALDGKLLSSNFNDEVKQFLTDYIQLDGLTTDLIDHFKVNIWKIPANVNASGEFSKKIDASLDNYRRNLIVNPKVVNFKNSNLGSH